MTAINRKAFLQSAAALSALSFLAACTSAPEVADGPDQDPQGDGSDGDGGDGSGTSSNDGGAGAGNGSGTNSGGSGAGDSASSGSANGGAGGGADSGSGGAGGSGSANGGAGGTPDPGPQCGDDPTATPDHPWHPPFMIALADVLARMEKTYDVTSPNHTHTVTLTAADFAELNVNGTITKTSTNDWGHTHEVVITCTVV